MPYTPLVALTTSLDGVLLVPPWLASTWLHTGWSLMNASAATRPLTAHESAFAKNNCHFAKSK